MSITTRAMHLPFTVFVTTLLSILFVAVECSTNSSSHASKSGYGQIKPSIQGNNFTFGQHFAVLNLDLFNFEVDIVSDTDEGKVFIKNVATWINAVHSLSPPPLSVYTRVYFANSHLPELIRTTPFAAAADGYDKASLFVESNNGSAIYPAFKPLPDYDPVLVKVRYYAGTMNELELILSTQKIDTVILSGIRTSGVILSTVYRLFDLNYKVFVIANNTIETPPNNANIHQAILEGIIPKLPASVITIEQALHALNRSRLAFY